MTEIKHFQFHHVEYLVLKMLSIYIGSDKAGCYCIAIDPTGREKTQIAKVSPKHVCKYWMNGDCVRGEHCRNLHSWFYGDGFATLVKLQGHKKLVIGIALPHGSNKLYSGSTDGTLRTWDCVTGQCTNLTNLGAEATSLISEGPWIFVGLPNIVKAWNMQTASHLTLDGPKGRVLAMVVGNDTLLAGAEAVLNPIPLLNWLHHYADTLNLLFAWLLDVTRCCTQDPRIKASRFGT
ncbi:zinc finger CCCH domain-containing protein 48-like [Vicia villosa]|uniref:zinc finger CCCH domain-containing protein 48-like n=1 Tax=Vicia villosa TaxID=3911 RepID=UPI00273C90DE|nr:zinc finger CCCH domain-containing protein 48-like [Vicia villosa]